MKEQIILFRKVNIICILIILQLLVGCSANHSVTEIDYEITLIDNEVMTIDNAQYYESYDNRIPYVIQEFTENDCINDIEYNLITLSDYSVTSLDINIPDNHRILSLVVFDSNHYLYSMIDQSNSNRDELFHYQVVRQKESRKEIIAEGYTAVIMNAPMFSVSENDVYFLLSSLDYSEDCSKGNYRIEFWKVGCDDASMLNQSVGKYEDFFLDTETEYYVQRIPGISESAVSFLSKKGNDMYLNRFADGNFQKIILNASYSNLISIDENGYLCVKRNISSENTDDLRVFYFDCDKNEYTEIQIKISFADYVSLSNGAVIGVDKNGVGWFLTYNGGNINIEELEIRNPIYFRRLSNKETLIFAYDKSWKTYKLSLN